MEKCPNCSTPLENHFVYCSGCGQKTHLHRFNVAHIGHELFHALTHADKGVLHLIKNLTLKPGVVAREYVLEEKRKRYFNPFTFLVLVLGLSVFVNSFFHPYSRQKEGAKPKTESLGIRRSGNPTNEAIRHRAESVSAFLNKRANLVAFAAIPIFALVFWLFFLKTGINYAEHLVANVFFAGYFQLVAVIITLLLSLVNRYVSTISELQLLFQLFYLPIAYYQFLTYRRWSGYLRTALATILALVVWSALTYSIIRTYITYGI